MAFSADYLEFVLEQLTAFGPIEYKKMFGGVGLYKDGLMFGGIMGGDFHLKVDDLTRPDFIARGMESFFHGQMQKGLASYYKVPAEILEDRDELKQWASRAYEAAARSKK